MFLSFVIWTGEDDEEAGAEAKKESNKLLDALNDQWEVVSGSKTRWLIDSCRLLSGILLLSLFGWPLSPANPPCLPIRLAPRTGAPGCP